MGLLDYMRRAIGTLSKRAEIAEKLTHDPTKDDRSRPFYAANLIIDKLPPYNRTFGVLMENDPIARLAFTVRNAAMMQAEVEIKAKDPRVRAWVQKQWACLWDHNRAKMTRAKMHGFSALQLVWERDKAGLLNVGRVKSFRTFDCKALEKGGEIVGARIFDKKMQCPQVIWQTFDEQYNDPYGDGGLFRRMYPPWYENVMDHGAKQLGQLWNLKYAMPADVFYYPPNMAVTMPNGTQIPWRDIVREMGEKRMSGAAMTIPMMYDDEGREMVKYTPPAGVAGGGQEWTWSDRCEERMLQAAGILLEVVKASGTGSGFSGRSIPFLVVLSGVQEEFNEIVRSAQEQALRPGAWLNFGGDPEFEIVPKSLVESFAQDASGSAMGGSAIGGPQSQRPQVIEGEYRRVPEGRGLPAPQSAQFDNDESKKLGTTQFDLNDDQSIAEAAVRAAYERMKQAGKLIKRQIRGATLTDPAWQTALETSLRLAVDGIGLELAGAMNAAGLVGAAEIAAALPPPALPPIIIPPVDPPSLVGFFDEDDGPSVTFPVLDEAVSILQSSPVATGATWQETAQLAKDGAFAVTADLSETAVTRLRDLLAETITEGGGEDEFAAKVSRWFDEGTLSENHLRTIFRTNVAGAMSGGKERAVTSEHVADSFPYRRYYATSDQRVRAEHRAMERSGLDGTAVYRSDDPVWAEFQPPFDWGCRCEWTPYTVGQAARAGVTEAVDWIERAKQRAGGEDYHAFLAETSPQSPQHVPHPPFHANPEFKKL